MQLKNNQMIRSFISIHLPEPVQNSLSGFLKACRENIPEVRWVKPQSLHITLKFLGDIDKKMVPEISNLLSEIGTKFEPFEISLEGKGAFPSLNKPRIFWLGIRNGKNELSRLAMQVEESMVRIGFLPENRPFKSHITVGRTRGRIPVAHTHAFIEANLPSLVFPAMELTLMESFLTPAGARYSTLSSHLFRSTSTEL